MAANKQSDLDLAVMRPGSYLADEPDYDLVAIVEDREPRHPGSALKLVWAIDHLLSVEFFNR